MSKKRFCRDVASRVEVAYALKRREHGMLDDTKATFLTERIFWHILWSAKVELKIYCNNVKDNASRIKICPSWMKKS